MDFVLFAFNFTNQKSDVDIDKIIGIIKSYESLFINDLCYIIKADVSTMEICEKIKPHMEIGKDELLITKVIDPVDCYGWGFLSPKKRDFFR